MKSLIALVVILAVALSHTCLASDYGNRIKRHLEKFVFNKTPNADLSTILDEFSSWAHKLQNSRFGDKKLAKYLQKVALIKCVTDPEVQCEAECERKLGDVQNDFSTVNQFPARSHQMVFIASSATVLRAQACQAKIVKSGEIQLREQQLNNANLVEAIKWLRDVERIHQSLEVEKGQCTWNSFVELASLDSKDIKCPKAIRSLYSKLKQQAVENKCYECFDKELADKVADGSIGKEKMHNYFYAEYEFMRPPCHAYLETLGGYFDPLAAIQRHLSPAQRHFPSDEFADKFGMYKYCKEFEWSDDEYLYTKYVKNLDD